MVVAGGSGNRFGSPKQFLLLGGQSMIARSVIAARAVADGVVLVLPASSTDLESDPLVDQWDVDRVVIGGSTRAASVRAGLEAVPLEAEVIVIHDAARPLAPKSLFVDVVTGLEDDGIDGVIPVLPITDTLKYVDGDVVTSTLDRATMVAVQTPQAFRATVLRAAHASNGDTTDDAGLLEAMGATVRTVPGDPRNLKVTHPGDLAVAEALLSSDSVEL